MQPLGGESKWRTRRFKAIDSNIREVISFSRNSTQAALLICSARGENRGHEFLHLLLRSRPLGCSCGVARRCFLCPLSTSEFLVAPGRSRISSRSVLRSPGVLTFGCGCTAHVGVDVGAGDVEVDVYNIHHERPIHGVLSTVQRQVDKWTTEAPCTVLYRII